MRRIFACLALSLTAVLQAAGTLTATPAVPTPGRPVTFMLAASPAPFGQVQWQFGDGSSATGGSVTTTTFASPGSYVVRALYRVLDGNGALSPPQVAQAQVRVADDPAAPFSISMLRLRWEDGGIDTSVPQGFTPLVAFLDLKCEGAGQLVLQWTVDGIPVGTLSRQVSFAGTLTVDSRDLPSLPATEPGEHRVSLQFLVPAVTFQVPTIRYFVRLDRGEAPRVDDVAPGALHPGEELDLQLTGQNFTQDMRLSFGKDVALVAPLRLLSPGKAVARVYVSPSARPGFRKTVAANANGKARGPGGVRVAPAEPLRKAAAGRVP